MKARKIVRNHRKMDEKGVSPVIGVILMVAATIVIAAVVLGMLGGFKAPTTTPVASISAENYVETSSSDIIIKHNGGDTLKANDFQISVVEVGNAPVYNVTITENFQAGDSIFIKSTTTGNATYYSGNNTICGGDSLTNGEKYNVKIKHISSNTVLLDTVVTVTGS